MKLTKLPLVSIIIPAYNVADYLADCLESVFKQTYNPFEVIVIDDGSTDHTATICQNFPKVRYVYQKNQGPNAARNHGISLAKGTYLSFLDADDTIPFDKIEKQVNLLIANPIIQFVRGETQFVNANLTALNRKTHGVYLGAMLFRKDVFEQIGLFDASFFIGGDLDFWRRCQLSSIHYLDMDTVALFYRQHDTNQTANQQKIRQAYLRVLKNEIARKRALKLAN